MVHNQLYAQSGKLRRLMKHENFDNAINFVNCKISEYESNPRKEAKLETFYLALGKIYYKLGEHNDAEKEYNLALNLALKKKASGKRLKLPDYDVIDDLALFYVNKGNFNQAKSLIDSSLKWRYRKLTKNDPTNFRPYLPLGLLYYYSGQTDSANYYLRAYQKNIRNSNYTDFLDINRYADTYQITAEIARDKGKLMRALRFSMKAARLQNHRWTKKESGKNYLARIRALNTLSENYRLWGKYLQASYYNNKALKLHRKKYEVSHFSLVPVYINKANIDLHYYRTAKVKEDLFNAMFLQQNFINENFNYLSEYEKENIYGSLKKDINEIQSLAFSLYQKRLINLRDTLWQHILDHTIRTKALVLSETNKIMEGVRQGKNPELKVLLDQWKRLKNEWAYVANLNTPKSKISANQLGNKIVKIEKQMSELVDPDSENQNIVSWNQVREYLKPGEAVLEIIRIELKGAVPDSSIMYEAALIKPGTLYPEIILIRNGYEMEHKLINNYFNSIRYAFDDTISYKAFWEPFNQNLPGVKKVYISSDGIFHLINFNILQDHGEYLADRIEIVNLTKIDRILARSSKQASKILSAALIGSQDFPEGDSVLMQRTGLSFVSPLPGTEKEIHAIDNILNKNKVNAINFLHDKASESIIKKLPSYDILHIATHGYYDNRTTGSNPMLNSGLILPVKNDPENDGLLTAYEASTLNLEKTRLVVLSACKTGLGTIRDGEGVYGLQRAFEAAGVKNVIISLWNINDETTIQFMKCFYSALFKNNNISTAFHQTELLMRGKYPEAEFWGAFKLITSY